MMRRRWGSIIVAVSLLPSCGGGATDAPPAAQQPTAKRKPAPAPVAEPEPEPAREPEPPPMPTTAATLDIAREAAKALHGDHRDTLLCQCHYAKSERVSPASCGYHTRGDALLARSIEWDHIVPPARFGLHRDCWTKPVCVDADGARFRGIECCQEVDKQFATMRTDLHNLAPFVGEVARDKSDYPYGELDGEPRLYGACDLEIDPDDELVEPMPSVRGDIARVTLYLLDTYPGAMTLSIEEIAMYRRWAAEDPPSAWERERAQAVTATQGMAPAWLSEVVPDPAADPPAEPAAEPAAGGPTETSGAPPPAVDAPAGETGDDAGLNAGQAAG